MASAGNGTPTEQPLGTCPRCGSSIPQRHLLIRYESEEGWTKMFAECRSCETPVHPR